MAKRFIALEGIDGAGKTTLRKHLFKAARRHGEETLNIMLFSWLIPEHTETITAVRFRGEERPAEEVVRAYVADKESLSDTIVRPHLEHRHVVSDRYIVSDMVYGEVHGGIAAERMYEAYCSSSILFPEVTVFLDTPPEIAYERMKAADGCPYITLEQQREICEMFRRVLLGDSFPQLRPVVRFENAGTREEGRREFEEIMLPILTDGRR